MNTLCVHTATGVFMHPLAGRKQSPEIVAKRVAAGAGRPDNTPEVLWSKVDRRGAGECWPWLGYRNGQGYGRTWINGKGYYAHRVIYDLACPGKITLRAPKNASEQGWLMHSCDNPCCCNPNHLSVATHLENMRDKVAKGRSPDFRGVHGPRAKLTSEQVAEIRRVSDYGISSGELAALFGVSKPTIKSVRNGRVY